MLILVTGASTGLGLGAARALTIDGHRVVIHARSTPPTGTENAGWHGVVHGDLTDLDETRDVARQANVFGRFDAVIHNAGVLHVLEAFTVNVVAPYVLTALIEKPGRLIYLSSSMHRSGSTDLGRIDRNAVTYSDSKLYVAALSAALAHRWEGTVTHAVDPGWVPTRMGGAGAPDDLTAGHQTQVWLATSEVTPATGGFWYHRTLQKPHPATQQAPFQTQLLRRLHSHTGIRLPD